MFQKKPFLIYEKGFFCACNILFQYLQSELCKYTFSILFLTHTPMKHIALLLLTLTWLSACTPSFELTPESIMSTYQAPDRSLNLWDKGIAGFVNMNGLNGDTEIVNLYLQNNDIERLDVSDYSDLGRLDISNNDINYLANIKFPQQIRHIIITDSNLSTLDGIESLSELKTLDIRNNILDEDDLKKLANLPKLQLILAEGNPDISQQMLDNLAVFNIKYLQSIKQL